MAVSLLVSFASLVQADTWTENPDKARRSDAVIKPDRPVLFATTGTSSEFVQQVIELTNRERLNTGLPALKRQQRLQESASWMAQDMSEHAYFDHRDSGRREMPARLSDFKYDGYHAIGENIAKGQRTPEEVVHAWMHSPGHRANILSLEFSETGVAFVPPSAQNVYGYWVQDFGSRFESCPVVVNGDAVCTYSPHIKISVNGADWVQEMRFSNNGLRWTAWETFQPVREWDLEPGTGKRTVFIEIRRAGRTARLEAGVQVMQPASMPGQIAAARTR